MKKSKVFRLTWTGFCSIIICIGLQKTTGQVTAPGPAQPITSGPPSQSPSAGEKKFQRLPTNVLPTLYALFFQPDLKNFKFQGIETVSLTISQATDTIILNCSEIEIKTIKLEILPTNEILRTTFTLSAQDETLTVKSEKILEPGNAKLTIEFSGSINDASVGVYRALYTVPIPNNEEYYIVTKFATTNARKCFPCWDEPSIKVPFDITLTVDKDKVALSTMPVEKETTRDDGLKDVKFKTTPKMSVHLLAFVAGYFDYFENTNSNNIVGVRIYTPIGKKEQGKFGADITTKAIAYYSGYLKVPFPLPKLTSVAISQLDSDGMENWGLITYLESAILDDSNNTSEASQQLKTMVMCEEIVHQWFGGLVTEEWWTYSWVNEGFATLMKYQAVDIIRPDFHIWTWFATDNLGPVLREDGYQSTRSLEVPIENPSEVDVIDELPYGKGASLLRMVQSYIGEEAFKKGINVYLTQHQFDKAVSEDLWTALEQASSKPLKKIMSSWTKQAGLPLVVIDSSTYANNQRTFNMHQKRFFYDPNGTDHEVIWTIPLLFSKKSKPIEVVFSTLFEGLKITVSVPDVTEDEWIKVNPLVASYHRTKYPDDLFQKFLPSIQDRTMPILDRWNLLDDLYAAAQCGEAKTTAVLDLIKTMKDDYELLIWITLYYNFDEILNLLLGTNFLPSYYSYGLKIVKSIAEKVGFDIKPNETIVTTTLRPYILYMLFQFEDPNFSEVALKKFDAHASGTSPLPPSLRGDVYRTVLAARGKPGYDALIKLYKSSDSQEEKYRILRSFMGVRDENLVDEILAFSLSKDVDTTGADSIIVAVSTSKVGREKTWEFVKKNYDQLRKLYGDDSSLWQLVENVTKNFTDTSKIQDIQTFLTSKNVDQANNSPIQQALLSIRINAAWKTRDEEEMKKYFENFKI